MILQDKHLCISFGLLGYCLLLTLECYPYNIHITYLLYLWSNYSYDQDICYHCYFQRHNIMFSMIENIGEQSLVILSSICMNK